MRVGGLLYLLICAGTGMIGYEKYHSVVWAIVDFFLRLFDRSRNVFVTKLFLQETYQIYLHLHDRPTVEAVRSKNDEDLWDDRRK